MVRQVKREIRLLGAAPVGVISAEDGMEALESVRAAALSAKHTCAAVLASVAGAHRGGGGRGDHLLCL